jgi:hypothetical protein
MTLNKKILTVFSVVVLLLGLCTSCSKKNKQVEEPQEETMTLSASDTTQVMNLMHQYFDLLLNKNFDGAMSMLSQLSNDSLKELSPEMKQHYNMGMRIVSPIRYELESMKFRTESDCLVRYAGILFDKEDENDKRPNKMYYAVKPVRLNGEWHLTVADDSDMNTRNSKIEM